MLNPSNSSGASADRRTAFVRRWLIFPGRPLLLTAVLLWLAWPMVCASTVGVLKRSDVVFMYQADREVYDAYGASVLAWGGKPTSRSLEQAKEVKFFGSVGMVTEFSRYHERFPENYQEGLCRGVNGQPVKVPWLTDHQHKGVPYWWCCTQQPNFRLYLKERVIETVRAGAHGVHIDDHMGTSGGLWLGLCFCERCVAKFRDYLASLPATEREKFGVSDVENFQYAEVVQRWITEEPGKARNPTQHPLWEHWTIYQCRAAAAFMSELHELANETAGRRVPMGANAGLLWPRHLADYQTLDLFSAETDHHASERKFSDVPLFAYRLADAVQRPYASTASGGDWAFVAANNTPGLVRGWIALSYAAGHRLMAPHRQWCYTPEKGTHWYQGPQEKFAPLYQFVRQNAELFDDYETYADVGIVLPHRAFVKSPNRWFDIGRELAGKNVTYRLILGGDAIVDHPLPADELRSSPVLLAPHPEVADLRVDDSELLAEVRRNGRVFARTDAALAAVKPAVTIEGGQPVRALARVNPRSAVVHLLNYAYDPGTDDIKPLENVRVRVDTKALGIAEGADCSLYEPNLAPREVEFQNGAVQVPRLGLWGVLRFK